MSENEKVGKTKLKPCECGGRAIGYLSPNHYSLICSNIGKNLKCYCSVTAPTKKLATLQWNTRDK